MTTLRPATEADVSVLIELARRSWLSGFAKTAPLELVRDRLAREFEREWYTRYWRDMTVAAAVDLGVVGVVQPMHDEINGLWVEPAAQGRGIGTALLRHGEQVIAAAGSRRVWLNCSGFNPRACQFYRAQGYRETGRRTHVRPDGVVEEMITYERLLSNVPDAHPDHGVWG